MRKTLKCTKQKKSMEIGGAVPIKEYWGVIENITSVKVNKKKGKNVKIYS